MSKTDKTRPFDVQMWDPHSRIKKVAHHDHRLGGCDLPATYEEHAAATWPLPARFHTRCQWSLDYTGIGFCSCSWCDGDWGASNERNHVRGTSRPAAAVQRG